MKRTYRYVGSFGEVRCTLPSGLEITLPVVPGLLKHPSVDELFDLLRDPDVARKYTALALVKAPWAVLRLFPREWLESCMAETELPAARARALTFMLS
jgi:hypothetical protein